MDFFDYDLSLARSKLAKLLGGLDEAKGAVRNRLAEALQNPQGVIDSVNAGLRNTMGLSEIDKQFALRDRINAGDQQALQEYRRLDDTVRNKLFDLATNFNPMAAGILVSDNILANVLRGQEGIMKMKNIKTEQQLIDAIANGDGQWIRWSRGPYLDKNRGGSRDYLSGSEHGAFSAVPINPEWATDPEWMSRRVGEYGFLRIKDPKIAPYIYSGEKVGVDSDGYDLINKIQGVYKIAPDLIDSIKQRFR